MDSFFSSLRVKLMLLVLIVVLPLLGLIMYMGLNEHDHFREMAMQNALSLAKNISSSQNDLVRNAQSILFFVSQMMDEHEHSPKTFKTMFARLSPLAPELTGLLITNADGEVIDRTYSTKQKLNISDLPYYQRVMQTKDFVIGEYLISRITGKPILTLLQPTLNKAGEVKNIIAAGIDLRHIHRVIEKSSFPAGAHVRIFDHNGTILYRYPDPGNYVGKKLPQDAVIKAALEKKEGLIEAIGLDGKPLLYGFTAFGRPGGAVYVSVGIPPEVAFAHVDKQFMYRLIWLILFTGVVLTLAWFWGEYYILRIMRHLLSTAQRVTSGDLHARVGSYYSHGEIGQLSEAFDKMLEELQKREGEARNAEARYRILFEQSPNGIVLVDTETGKTVEANETAYQQLGYTRDEFAELRISDYEVEENPE